jgi:hypothetical protein
VAGRGRILLGAALVLIAAGATRDRDPLPLEAQLMEWLRDVAGERAAGRGLGTDGHQHTLRSIEGAAASLGLKAVTARGAPATLPLVRLRIHENARLAQAGVAGGMGIQLAGVDMIPLFPAAWGYPATRDLRVSNVPIVLAGRIGEIPAALPGKWQQTIVLVEPPLRPDGLIEYDIAKYVDQLEAFRFAHAIGIVAADLTPTAFVRRWASPRFELTGSPGRVGAPPVFLVTDQAARIALGAAGQRADLRWQLREERVSRPPRNLAFVLEGRDPRLRNEYVVVSAPSDYLGTQAAPGGEAALFPGADDGGSGMVALLGVARLLAAADARPARSVLFVWHSGTEHALLGSEWMLRHPVVPPRQMVAVLNVERLARGPDTLFAVGQRRLGSPLGEWLDAYAARTGQVLDWSWDAPGDPLQRDCRSDHLHYALAGIPALTINSGVHEDWRRPSDGVEAIDPARFARRVEWFAGLVREVADQPQRAELREHPAPEGARTCVQ